MKMQATKVFCLGKAKGPKFWTDLAPLSHFPSGSMQTTSNVAFVHLRRRYHRALPVVYRPKLMMERIFLRRLDPGTVCNLLWVSEPTVTCTLKKTHTGEGVRKPETHPEPSYPSAASRVSCISTLLQLD